MAKESNSPKVERASRHPRRGHREGDKIVNRGKRRSTGVERVPEGGDIMSRIRTDRTKNRTTNKAIGLILSSSRPKYSRNTPLTIDQEACRAVLNTAGPRLVELAKSADYSSGDKAAACTYLKILAGSAQGTVKIDTQVMSQVQQLFTEACLERDIERHALPGQDSKWYARLLETLATERLAQDATPA